MSANIVIHNQCATDFQQTSCSLPANSVNDSCSANIVINSGSTSSVLDSFIKDIASDMRKADTEGLMLNIHS